MKKVNLLSSASVIILIFTCSMMDGRSSIIIQDDFNDSLTDSTLWSTVIVGTGATIQEANGRLEITIPGNSISGPGPNYYGMAAYYLTKAAYAGDFDAQVDFQLLNWPNANGVRVGLSVGAWQDVERDSVVYRGDGRDAYVMSLWPGLAIRDTTDQSGKLRLIRVDNIMSGFFWDSSISDWVQLGSSIYPAGDKPFALSVWTDDNLFAHKNVAVAFDNFRVTSAGSNSQIVPEGSTNNLFGLVALGMLIFIGPTLHGSPEETNQKPVGGQEYLLDGRTSAQLEAMTFPIRVNERPFAVNLSLISRQSLFPPLPPVNVGSSVVTVPLPFVTAFVTG